MPNPNPKRPPHLWKKGQSGNPKGSSARHRLSGDIGRLTHEEVAEVGSFLLKNNLGAVKDIIRDPNSSLAQVWTASLVIKSMNKGDSATYERLMNRIVGRVKESYEITGKDGEPLNQPTKEQLEAQLAVLRAANAEMGDD